MKTKLFVFVFCIAMAIVSCHTPSTSVYDPDIVYGAAMTNAYEAKYSVAEFKQLCSKDRIPSDLSKWHRTLFIDGETRKGYNEYMYIKQLGTSEAIYRVESLANTDSVYVTKRITK